MERLFRIQSEYQPAGDQPKAIEALVSGVSAGQREQSLLGVTGSGKTFTLANVVQEIQRPTLVISHNKVLAAQLFSEFRSFFPDNRVEYFISYYDYYQPEAYLPQTDTYIAKDASINEEIEKLRLSATSSLVERRDVLVVASVSCIYGLGSPEDFEAMRAHVTVNAGLDRDELLRRLIDIQYERNDSSPSRGQFRAAGDTVEVYPSYRDEYVRIEFWGSTVDRVTVRDALNHNLLDEPSELSIFPAKHFVIPQSRIEEAVTSIKAEMEGQVAKFERERRLIEAQRIHERTMYDIEMMRELGYCSGIENYSRHLAGRKPGSRPDTLIDYFPDDLLLVIDESHVTIPQLNAMYNADRNRKETLVEHGFRLPSALDNRPLKFAEFERIYPQVVYVSATPGDYELARTKPVEQVIRPTGLLDPEVVVRPLEGQIDDLMEEVRRCAEASERVLVTTLTKRTAEDLTDYLRRLDLRVRYMHSEVDAIERVELVRSLRQGDFDCLVGINLLREGLDLPEVSLVAILDADKEGFLRSERSLVQTAGRAARHLSGRVILYADEVTDSMRRMIEITAERRKRQQDFNQQHCITPRSIRRAEQTTLRLYGQAEKTVTDVIAESGGDYDVQEAIRQLQGEMKQAADALEFERAALIRDQIRTLERQQ